MKNFASHITAFVFTTTICLFMICIIYNSLSSGAPADSLKENLELYTTDDIIFHDAIVECANAYDALLGWEVHAVSEYNSIIFLEDDYLATCLPRHSDETIHRLVASVSEFNNLLAEHEIPLLYIQMPSKVCIADAANNILDFSNDNTTRFLEGLQNANISYMDLHPRLHEITDNHHSLYFKTDHHWKPETGLFCAGIICDYLNSAYDFETDITLFNSDNFRYDVFEDYFLGSQGKKVTLARTSPEDITLIYPLENTKFSLAIPSDNIEASGSFDIIYNYEQLDDSDLYEFNPYAAYLYGDNAYTHLVNANVLCDKQILIIKDSFANSIIPFLSLGIETIDFIDLRYYTESLQDFLEQNEYHYDLVIILYSSHTFGEIDYDSHTSLWDFR